MAAPPLVAALATFPGTEPAYRFWTGADDLTYDGATYQGRDFVALAPAEATLGAPNRRMTASFAFAGLPRAQKNAFLQDPGPLTVELEWIYSDDQGQTWARVPRKFVGRLSRPRIVDGIYTIEIETWGGDVDRGRPRKWSHEDQRARDPTDRGMEYMRPLAAGVETRWPP